MTSGKNGIQTSYETPPTWVLKQLPISSAFSQSTFVILVSLQLFAEVLALFYALTMSISSQIIHRRGITTESSGCE